MTLMADKPRAPAVAYNLIAPLLPAPWFLRSMEYAGRQGLRVELTAASDGMPTQWEFDLTDWARLHATLMQRRDYPVITARVLKTW